MSAKRSRIRWDPDTERKLIEMWADILTETDGLMLTIARVRIELLVLTSRLNKYIAEELT